MGFSSSKTNLECQFEEDIDVSFLSLRAVLKKLVCKSQYKKVINKMKAIENMITNGQKQIHEEKSSRKLMGDDPNTRTQKKQRRFQPLWPRSHNIGSSTCLKLGIYLIVGMLF